MLQLIQRDMRKETVFVRRNQKEEDAAIVNGKYTEDTKITDVIMAPVFGDYGRLIFPVDEGYYSGKTLGELRLIWYSNTKSEKTVEIANYMKEHAAAGDVIFYDIYTNEEKKADPAKEDTGHHEYREADPPTYACVGSRDGIANWQIMRRRLQAMENLGIPTEFHVYEGLGHGFGLGAGTVADGWIDDAVDFWEEQMEAAKIVCKKAGE